MALPVFASGSKVRASVLAQLVAELQNLFNDTLKVVKPSNTSRTSTTTLAADPHMVIALEANTTYDFEIRAYWSGAAAGDISFAMAFPASSSVTWGGIRLVVSASPTGDADFGIFIAPTSAVSAINAGGVGGDQMSLITGTVVVGATPGNLTLWWAQGTSSGTATILWARSTMVARRYRSAP
jgi:hypothetical protein